MSRWASRVQVYNSNISSLFQLGGTVNRRATDITLQVMSRAVAKSLTFSRSGHLAASHRRAVIPSGIYGTRGYVENTASYAGYKHDGVDHPIVSRRAFSASTKGNFSAKMRLKAWGPYPVIFRAVVRGQKGSPWLLEAANEVLVSYGVHITQGEGIDLV